MKVNYKRTSIGLAIICVILAGSLTYTLAQVPTSTFNIAPGIYPSGPSYTVWREGSYYFAKNQNGYLAYSDDNFTTLITDCLTNLPTLGGKIYLRTGEYVGMITISRSNVIIEGEGVYDNIPAGLDPGKAPSWLKGTVIKPLSAQDGIHIEGANRTNIQIRDLGIWFTTASTGCGITTDLDQQFHLKGAVIENIKILNHDKDSYALRLCNFLFLYVKHIQAYGGPLLEIYANLPYFSQGNSVFDDLYCEITYDLSIPDYVYGPYPIFIHVNDSIAGYPWFSPGANLLTMRRIQINNPTAQTDGDYFTCVFWGLKTSTIEGLNLEGVTSTAKAVRMGSCQNVIFINAYVWAMLTDCEINIASNNQHITWINSFINGDILDSNQTNLWINTFLSGDIIHGSYAYFKDLSGNSGYATLANGQTNVNITARFIGPYDYITLAIIDDDANETIKVDQWAASPTNLFTVTTTDEGTDHNSINFFWKVEHYVP